jgi:hypothetical protein
MEHPHLQAFCFPKCLVGFYSLQLYLQNTLRKILEVSSFYSMEYFASPGPYVRQLGIAPQMTCKAPLQWWRCSVMSEVLIQGTCLGSALQIGAAPLMNSSSSPGFFDYLPRVFLFSLNTLKVSLSACFVG